MVADIMNMMLPKLYAISAMWTLNSRESIRAAAGTGPAIHTINLGTAGSVSGASCPDTGRHLLVGESLTIGSQNSAPLVEDEKLQLDSQAACMV
jgi:hypothetical protein